MNYEHQTDELQALYVVEKEINLPETVHKIRNTCEMPGGLYFMIELDCVQEALLFTGNEAYLMQSQIIDQWYLFVPFAEK
jgi:hypothetical protein